MHPRQARFLDRRHVGRREPALLVHDAEGLDAAGAIERQRLPRLETRQVDLARHQVLHGRRAAAIRHELQLDAGFLREIDEAHVRAAAGADRAGRPVGVGLEPGDQLLDVRGRQILAPDDTLRADREHLERLKIGLHVERQRIHRAATDIGCPLADADGVAVGGRAIETGEADGAAGAAHVLCDHRLAERGPHVFGDEPRNDVGDAAGREGHDHSDRARRIGLRKRARDAGQDERDRENNPSHVISSSFPGATASPVNDAEYHHIVFDDCVVNCVRIANERYSSDTLSLLDPLCTLGISGNPLDDAPDALFESGRLPDCLLGSRRE